MIRSIERQRLVRRRCCRDRRGVVAVIVLLLIAVTLAASYAAMRSQTMDLSLRHNAGLDLSARRAALTGLSAALKEMHSPNWAGTGSTLRRSLSGNESFEAEFVAGDANLTESDPELPYRVTINIVGKAWDSTDAGRSSMHSLSAVARLIPRELPDEPSDWSDMQSYVFYQTGVRETSLCLPCRIEGRLRLQGRLKLSHYYPNDWDAWWQYLHDQMDMRFFHGLPEVRVLTGSIDLPPDAQVSEVMDILDYWDLQTKAREARSPANDWTKPEDFQDYRLYEGGPRYAIPRVSGTLEQDLSPSVAENPLGIYYCHDDLTIDDDVTIQGTLFCRRDIRIIGENVRFESVEFPPAPVDQSPWHAFDPSIRLPAVCCSDFEVQPDSSCTVDGLLVAFDEVEVERGTRRGTLEVTGRIIAEDFDIRQDVDWQNVEWEEEYEDYDYYTSVFHFDVPLFTVWMKYRGYPYEPTVYVKEGDDAHYHWHWPGDSIFVPHADDFSEADGEDHPGLRWELVELSHLD